MPILPILPALAVGLAAMSPQDARPVRLDLTRDGDVLDVAVVGAGPIAGQARFELTVESIGRGGRTATTQHGERGAGAVQGRLLHSRISVSNLEQWAVRLNVTVDGTSYVDEREGAGGAG